MTTLTTAPLAPLLDQLFVEAEAATSPELEKMPLEERVRLAKSKTEYVEFYSRVKTLWLPVSRETGNLLYLLARSIKAKNIVEFGTSFGVSSLCLAAALRDNGGGRLITSEFEPSKVARARVNIEAAGLGDLVDFREGDALRTLGTDLSDTIDLVFLDGAKPLYGDILALLEDRLRPGSLIVADDVDMSPDYVARIRSISGGYLSTSFGDDVEISMRLT